MKKRFDRYFKKNIARKLYIVSIALIAIGAIVGFLYWWRYGMPPMIIGVLGFFITSGIQVSDKDVDECVENSIEELKMQINGKQIGKETLDSKDFSFFKGFIRTDSETYFVAGSDGRIRTSKYFITAMSSNNKSAKVFSVIFDLLSEDKPNIDHINLNIDQNVDLSVEELDFPSGIKKCELTVGGNDGNKSFIFYLPNDALADKHLENIKKQ